MRMKTVFLASMISVAAAAAFAQAAGPVAAAPMAAASRVVAVTVYTDRALVTRLAELDLPRGLTTLVFTGLPAATDPASIQVSGTGAFTLRDVRVAARQVTRDMSAQLRKLEDEKKAYDERLAAANDATREAELERAFLAEMVKRLTSNAGASETLPLDVAAWAKMLDFQRARNAAIDESLRKTRAEALALQAESDRLAREIRALGSGGSLSVLEAELVLETSAPVKASIELSYLVSGPTWRPDYVLRADSEAGTLSVQYRATVRQSTGESWDGVNLSLSTARPQTGGSLPVLQPWYIDLYKPQPLARESAVRGMAAPAPSAASSADFEWAAKEEDAPMEYASAQASTGATAVLFSIPGATSLASDNKERTVTVAVLQLPAAFSWAAVPKHSPFAYFMAEVTNDSEFPFLAGVAHVYVDGSYVADASMGAVPGGGKFTAGLGVDESVRVERTLVKKFDETTGVISKKEKTTWEYGILVANGKKREIRVLVSDQLPVSMDEQVVVKLLAPAWVKDSDSLRRTGTDTFEWTLVLAPGKEVTLPLSFSVEYPKGTTVVGLE